MKAGTPNDPLPEMRAEENDPLWQLLARSPRPEPDAWFAARTMARCRHEGPGSEASVTSLVGLVRVWRWALGGGLAFCMALTLMITQIQSEKAAKQKNVQEAFEIMASIDNDSDSSSSSSTWQDSSF